MILNASPMQMPVGFDRLIPCSFRSQGSILVEGVHFNENHLRVTIDALPDQPALLNCEPLDSYGRMGMNWWTDPDRATTTRWQLVTAIRRMRPSLEFGLYSLPEPNWRLAADPGANGMATHNQAVDYMPIADQIPRLFVGAYWWWDENENYWNDWVKYTRAKISQAEMYYRKVPTVCIWHRSRNGYVPRNVMTRMVDWLAAQDLDICFWANKRDEDFPLWLKYLLWSRA